MNTAPNLTASILIEALPYIQRFHQKTIVIKYGGNAMVDEQLKASFAQDIVLLQLVGIHPIIVHGGGPQIGTLLSQLGKESLFIDGLRVTDQETMDIVEMVLGGKVNKSIVSLINHHGGQAVGLSGKDANLIRAQKINFSAPSNQPTVPELIDLGQVGEVKEINTNIINVLKDQNFIPVIAPIGFDNSGNSLNINADFVASAIAQAVGAEKLILLTNTAGVLDKKQQLITKIRVGEIKQLIDEGTLSGGMIPKCSCACEAIAAGVNTTHIIDGRVPHSILLEVLTDKGIGTLFTK